MEKVTALLLLRRAVNDPSIDFREGQWESIDNLVNRGKRLLVIQRTGWGKSSVYFISAKALRNEGKGLTIIISPLLALMRNQIESAQRLGVNAVSINSTNYKDWEEVKKSVVEDNVDALLISPERLSNEDFMSNVLQPIADKIGLFVVDEAHCISDWGHDFRPDYRRIIRILQFLPQGLPVLGTTATANQRVCKDIQRQLGDIDIYRGQLTRESLVLQNIVLKDQASRLAWLRENIMRIPGSGIVYTLTKRDAHIVTDWLNESNIEAAYYYSGAKEESFEDSNEYRQYVEDALYNNELKVLVATSALGMGYDKPDLGFVIHYQAPSSIISYYQQVGRAGRAIDTAFGILLSGSEDEDIHEYFRESAFPPEKRVNQILIEIENHGELSVPELTTKLNLRKGQIEQVLKYLQVEDMSPVIKVGSKWRRTAVEFKMDSEKIKRLTMQRVKEWGEVKEYLGYSGCLMNFLQDALDDSPEKKCGRCYNCNSKSGFSTEVSLESGIAASLFLKHSEFEIKLRIRIDSDSLSKYDIKGNIPPDLRAEKGMSLSRWGDAGWGKIVAQDKLLNHFRDELVDAFAQMINERWNPQPRPTWVTCIPSLRRPELVPSFAKRLAKKLGIPFYDTITKVEETPPQKQQENSYFQAKNLDGVFKINDNLQNGEPVLLIDDVIDSGWTLTIASILLKRAGCAEVYPATLTSTSVS